MRKILLTGIFLFIAVISFGQIIDSTGNNASEYIKGDTNLSLLIGYNFWKYHYGELGFAVSRLDKEDHHVGGFNIYLSSEIKIDRDLLIGPKAGIWLSNSIGGIGLNLICYSDLEQTAWRFRPEYGLGMTRFKLVYGYNIALTNKDFKEVNKSNISLNILVSFLKIKKGTASK